MLINMKQPQNEILYNLKRKMNNIKSKLVAKKLHGVITFLKNERKSKSYVFMYLCGRVSSQQGFTAK